MIDQLKKEILNGDNTNVCYSENGAKMNASTGKNLLDLSFKVPTSDLEKIADFCIDCN